MLSRSRQVSSSISISRDCECFNLSHFSTLEQHGDQVFGVRALETRMADVALRTADASELATYLSHVYRQPIPTDHVAVSNASTSTMCSGSGTLRHCL